MLKQRILTGVIMAALLLSALFWLPQPGWALLMLALVLVGAYEWARLAKYGNAGMIVYLVLSATLMAGVLAIEQFEPLYTLTLHWAVYIPSALFWLLLTPLWLARGWHVKNPVLLALAGWVLLIPTGLAMVELRGHGPLLLLAVMALVWLADTAAYFSGRKFGKHKLAPAISPGKTWEGVAGALVGATVYAVLVAWKSGHAHGAADYLIAAALAWLGVAVSVEGDLFESSVKRQAGVKDSGKILPGHGGILDRIDAMTSTLPLAALAFTVYLMQVAAKVAYA